MLSLEKSCGSSCLDAPYRGVCGRLHEREGRPGRLKMVAVNKLTHMGDTYEHKEGAQGSDHPYHKIPQTANAVSGKPLKL